MALSMACACNTACSACAHGCTHACLCLSCVRIIWRCCDCFLNALKPGLRQQPRQKFTLTYPHISSLWGIPAEDVPHKQNLGVRESRRFLRPPEVPWIIYYSLYFRWNFKRYGFSTNEMNEAHLKITKGSMNLEHHCSLVVCSSRPTSK